MSERRNNFNKNREPRKINRGSFIRGNKRKRRFASWKRCLILLALAALFLYGTISLILYAAQSAKTRQTNEELQAMYAEAAQTPKPEAPASEPAQTPSATPEPELLDAYQYIGDVVLPEMKELLKKNPDTVAWIRIPGVVSLPVVYRDNTHYLDHDFYGKKNDRGTLFLDEAHPLEVDTQYMVVHGHAMYDGSMFGLLTHYRKSDYAAEHPTVYFDTLYCQEEYEVVSVLKLPVDVLSEGYIPYIGTRKFRSTDHFYSFAEQLMENTLYWKEGSELRPSDALLALSTCYDDERIVVMCRRIMP